MICPSCSASLLRHVKKGGIYWFCPSCRQSMSWPQLAKLPAQPTKD